MDPPCKKTNKSVFYFQERKKNENKKQFSTLDVFFGVFYLCVALVITDSIAFMIIASEKHIRRMNLMRDTKLKRH